MGEDSARRTRAWGQVWEATCTYQLVTYANCPVFLLHGPVTDQNHGYTSEDETRGLLLKNVQWDSEKYA